MAIVNSLFSDYLGFADRRDPMLINAPATSSISKSTVETTTAPAKVLPDETGGLISTPTTTTSTEPTQDEIAAALAAAGIDLSGLESLDLFGGTPLNLGPFGTESVMSMTKYL